MLTRLARATIAVTCLGAIGVAAAIPQAAKDPKKAPAGPDGRYEIDAVHSVVIFKISHVGISNFYGRFNKMSGKLLIDAEKPSESMIMFTIDPASVDTANADRDKHLRNADFFNVEEFPTIEFESEKVKAIDATHLEVAGTLKLHGVEKQITVKAEQTGFGTHAIMGERVGYEARFKINRSEFGMGYQPGALGEEVELIVSIEGGKSK